MKKIFTATLFLALSLWGFSQCNTPIKIVMFWETENDKEHFQSLTKSVDTSKYTFKLARTKEYQDTAVEFQKRSSFKLARVSPYDDITFRQGSFVKFYCNKTGMCLGTLWASRYSITFIEDGYERSLNLSNDIIAFYKKKSQQK